MLIVQYPKVLDVVSYAGDTVTFGVPAPHLDAPNDGFAGFAQVRTERSSDEVVTEFDVEQMTDSSGQPMSALTLTLHPIITEALTRDHTLRRLPIPHYDELERRWGDHRRRRGAHGRPQLPPPAAAPPVSPTMGFRQGATQVATAVMATSDVTTVRPLGLGPSSRRMWWALQRPLRRRRAVRLGVARGLGHRTARRPDARQPAYVEIAHAPLGHSDDLHRRHTGSGVAMQQTNCGCGQPEKPEEPCGCGQSMAQVLDPQAEPEPTSPFFGLPTAGWLTADQLKCDPEYAEDAIAIASNVLYVLSGRKYPGLRRITEEYMGQGCGGQSIRVSATHTIDIPNSARSYRSDGPRRLWLRGRPVWQVYSLERIDTGECVEPGHFAVFDHRGIEATDCGCYCWDICCGLRVSYSYGAVPPAAGIWAAKTLAEQICLGMGGSAECRLPERVTSVSRQGVSYSILDPQDFLDKGRTGLYAVDLFLETANPDRAKLPARVFNPDWPRGRRRTGAVMAKNPYGRE